MESHSYQRVRRRQKGVRHEWRKRKWRFFYANEHEPKHIHVMKNDGFAKIEIESMKVVNNYLKLKDLKLALEIMKENRDDFKRI